MKHYSIALLVAAGCMTSCLPAQLDKYRNSAPHDVPREPPLPNRGEDDAAPPSTASDKARASRSDRKPSARDQQQAQAAPPRATIYAVDKQTFRFTIREPDVWDSALSVLLKNYNLTIVDRQSGIIATEWDSYYLNNAVYRNKLSLRVVKSGNGTVDLTVHNNVERLRDAAQAAGTVGAVWLPSQDPGAEVSRIVQNMALVLGQPPPVLPPNTQIAKGYGTRGESEQLSR